MDFVTILLIALGLAMDCFAVSLGIGCKSQDCHQPLPVPPAIPFWVVPGRHDAHRLGAGQHHCELHLQNRPLDRVWIAGVRGHQNDRGEFFGCRGKAGRGSFTRGLLGDAEHCHPIDALAVGLSLAFMEGSIWISSLVIALVSAGCRWLGLLLGGRLGEKFGKRMELVGGLILIGIGLRILFTHIF